MACQQDTSGQTIAANPQEAGQLVGEAVRQREQQSRQNNQNLYQTVFAMPGDISASAFRGIANRIQQGLSNRANPVIIGDVTTPIASRALRDRC